MGEPDWRTRPRVPLPRRNRVVIALRDAEIAAIRAGAEAAQQTVSEWIRAACAAHASRRAQ